MEEYGNSFSVSNDELVKDYLNHIDEWSSQVNMYTMLDKGIYEVVQEEAGSYFKEEKTAQEVAKILQNRIHMMLNE